MINSFSALEFTMDDPLELPIPVDPIEKIHDFARDLAFGVVQGYWTSTIITDVGFTGTDITLPEMIIDGEKLKVLYGKWGNPLPLGDLLYSFDYLKFENKVRSRR